MLQNESNDEELEHFEDVIEETAEEPSTAAKEEENDGGLVHSTDAANSDSESSEDEDESPAFNSEDDGSDGAEEFLMRNDSKDLEESKIVSPLNARQPQVSSKKSLLPGGYDPRHREPSYWSVIYSKFIFYGSHFSLLATHLGGQLKTKSIDLTGSKLAHLGDAVVYILYTCWALACSFDQYIYV